MNKKQKKQMEVARKKHVKLQQLLNGLKQQMDDPAEVARVEAEIAEVEAHIEDIKAGG